MGRNDSLAAKLTILVNTCDSYDDLWVPFFTLLKKYWNPKDIRILLNTESKSFAMDGLAIECVHSPADYPYGKRMLNVLSKVKTKYVLPLLDDFFLRTPVRIDLLEQIIEWMEYDSQIAYFNCDCNKAYVDWEVNCYPGYRRLPPGNEYIFSMQAAVWRTEKLIQYWRPDVTPWEWEIVCNLLSIQYFRDKHYCLLDLKHTFLDYGFNYEGMGVYRGKWVKEDVVPLFEKEGIMVDYSKRGFYDPADVKSVISNPSGRWDHYKIAFRCMGKRYVVLLFLFEVHCGILRRMNKYSRWDNFYCFLQQTTRDRFMKKQRMK